MLLALSLVACKTAIDFPVDTDPPTPTGTDQPTEPPTDTDEPQCDAHAFAGQVYNCDDPALPDLVDRCDDAAANFTARFACCDCDPSLCNATADCPPGLDDTPAVPPAPPVQPSGCMTCHNLVAVEGQVYSGPGLSNPHPFGSAAFIDCETCHGGDPQSDDADTAHVAPPPLSLLGAERWRYEQLAHAGLDQLEAWDHPVSGASITGLDYLQFVNPGDLRVVAEGRSCGMSGCHGDEHTRWSAHSPMGTAAGVLSSVRFSTGVPQANGITLWDQTASDHGFRAVDDFFFLGPDEAQIGRVPELLRLQDPGLLGGPLDGPLFTVAALLDGVGPDGSVVAGSMLSQTLDTMIGDACGACHLGSTGEQQSWGQYRSGGCTACHMASSPSGRSRSDDPNLPHDQPFGEAPGPDEVPHQDSHHLRSVGKTLFGGGFVRGIEDTACMACHIGSNQTALQYWGVRLDQNADVTQGRQYPAQPSSYADAVGDSRFFGTNATFAGRVPQQLLVLEDYDGDGRDDTPPDVHHEAGMGCIDCHGSADAHGGTEGMADLGIRSQQAQATYVTCESCHGTLDGGSPLTSCVDYRGQSATCATDTLGNPLRNVTVQGDQRVLRGRIDDVLRTVPQVAELVDATSTAYRPGASYAMGRLDGDPTTGVGPQQAGGVHGVQGSGFSHLDDLSCSACHAAWTNSCVGCHLDGVYDADPASFFFSNLTGERAVIRTTEALIYASPLLDLLTVGPRGRIVEAQLSSPTFYGVTDSAGDTVSGLAFRDRNGNGLGAELGALAHARIASHTTRGRATQDAEGVKSCLACHDVTGETGGTVGLAGDLDGDGVSNGEELAAFRAAIATGDHASLDYPLLQQVLGRNPQNTLGHPIKVAVTTGTGSGLFLFDGAGCPVNPLDDVARGPCPPASQDWPARLGDVLYSLDRVVEPSGQSNASLSQPILDRADRVQILRDGATTPTLAGPLGATLIGRLSEPATGIVLDSWMDAQGAAGGQATDFQPDLP